MKCNWCGNNQDQSNILIAGPGVYICDLCTFACIDQHDEKIVNRKKNKEKCHFCGGEPTGPNEILHQSKDASICTCCLNQCQEIIQNHTTHKREHAASKEKCTCENVWRSSKEVEWSELAEGTSNDTELFRKGTAWLRKNKTDEAAGEAIAKLLKVKHTDALITMAENWLAQNPDHISSSEVIGALIKVSPSRKIIGLAKAKLKNPTDIVSLESIINAVSNSEIKGETYRLVECLLDKDPQSLVWVLGLRCNSKVPPRNLVMLKAHWLELNVDRDLPFISLHRDLSSPEIRNAALKWMGRGGRRSQRLPMLLGEMIVTTRSDQRADYNQVMRFARKWLKDNSDQEDAGKIYADILWATKSNKDINQAKEWYLSHKNADRAWLVISNILDLSYWSGKKPDPLAVEEARRLLRNKNVDSKPRLVGALLGVAPTPDVVTMAKEIIKRHRLIWIIVRLLLVAPDAEVIAREEETYPNWKDREDLEPEMIYAIIKADPRNKLARRRLAVWRKLNPNNRFIQAIDKG